MKDDIIGRHRIVPPHTGAIVGENTAEMTSEVSHTGLTTNPDEPEGMDQDGIIVRPNSTKTDDKGTKVT